MCQAVVAEESPPGETGVWAEQLQAICNLWENCRLCGGKVLWLVFCFAEVPVVFPRRELRHTVLHGWYAAIGFPSVVQKSCLQLYQRLKKCLTTLFVSTGWSVAVIRYLTQLIIYKDWTRLLCWPVNCCCCCLFILYALFVVHRGVFFLGSQAVHTSSQLQSSTGSEPCELCRELRSSITFGSR